MERNLKDKVVLITGGATGIGYEIADAFLKRNPKVVIIVDIDEKLGGEAVKRLNAKYGDNKTVFYKCDVTLDLEGIHKKITDTFKVVHVLVNNAGTLDESNVQKTIDVNVTAVILWSLKFFEHMRSDKSGAGGTIINMASIYGYRYDSHVPVYSASKFAVMGLTTSLGHVDNFRRFGVRVVAICPGFTDTQLVADVKCTYPEEPNEFQEFVKHQIWQKVDAVGKAALDVFETAESGTAWLIEGANPISQV